MNLAQPTHEKALDSGISNIIMIASGKGGVGKTWFSINLTMLLAKKGKKVLLFDGDLGLANIDIQLGLSPERDISDYIDQECELSDLIVSYDNQFDLIAGRSGCGSLSRLSSSKLELLKEDLALLSKKYDYLILDLGAGLGGTVSALSQLAGKCFLITTTEPTSITDAYAFLKFTTTSNPDLELKLVINQSPSQRIGLQSYEILKSVCQNFIQYEPKLAGLISEDKKVPDSIRHQQALSKRYPNASALKEIERIVSGSLIAL